MTPVSQQAQVCSVCESPFFRYEWRKFCSRRCLGISKRLDPIAAFWSRVQIGEPDECWPWTGEVNNKGYARFTVANRPQRIRLLGHRYSYELATGEQIGRRVVMHSCDNPPCVNPAHLSLGTQADNLADARAKGRLNTDGLVLGQRLRKRTPANPPASFASPTRDRRTA